MNGAGDNSGKQPLVWIIDREQWPRANLRAGLIERGYDAVGHIRIRAEITCAFWRERRAGRCKAPRRRRCGDIVEERQRSRCPPAGVPVILLGGAVGLQQPGIGDFEWAAVLQRPVTLGEIADCVRGIIPRRSR